jgi:hypothetical protein
MATAMMVRTGHVPWFQVSRPSAREAGASWTTLPSWSLVTRGQDIGQHDQAGAW